jgi:ferredoxin
MPIVIYDYSKCTGVAECAESCPVDILEGSANGRWCKPVDDEVENNEVLQKYYDEVDQNDSSDLILRFEMPSCIECRTCEAVCPESAIEIES